MKEVSATELLAWPPEHEPTRRKALLVQAAGISFHPTLPFSGLQSGPNREWGTRCSSVGPSSARRRVYLHCSRGVHTSTTQFSVTGR